MVEFSDLFDGELEEFQKKAKVSTSFHIFDCFKTNKAYGLLRSGLVFDGFDYKPIIWFFITFLSNLFVQKICNECSLKKKLPKCAQRKIWQSFKGALFYYEKVMKSKNFL